MSADIRALAQHFFDSVQRGDIPAVLACYAPDAAVWHNTDGAEQTRDENGATLTAFARAIPERTYDQRRLDVFEGGFVQQHVLNGVRRDGTRVSLAACIVCRVVGGKITRLDEYFDSAAVAAFIGARA